MSNYFLMLGSGMFYDGNHTYLIEPEENETSQVSAPFAMTNVNVDAGNCFSPTYILSFILFSYYLGLEECLFMCNLN
jgi:hypothetical protein